MIGDIGKQRPEVVGERNARKGSCTYRNRGNHHDCGKIHLANEDFPGTKEGQHGNLVLVILDELT